MPATSHVLPVLHAVLAGNAVPADLDPWCGERITTRLSGLTVELRASSAAATRYTQRLFTPGNPLWSVDTDAAAAPTTIMRTIALSADGVSTLADSVRTHATGSPRHVQMHVRAPATWLRTPAGQVLLTDPDAPIAPQILARHNGSYTVVTCDDSDAVMNAARHLREIGYRRAENNGWVCLHASAATIDGRGILIVGNSGAGKSSIALAAATAAGGAFLANDRTMIATSAGTAPEAVAMPGPIRLNGGTLRALGLNNAQQWHLTRPKPPTASDWQNFQGASKLHILAQEWHEHTGTPLASTMTVDLIIFPQVLSDGQHIDVQLVDAGRTLETLQAQCMSPDDDIYVCDWLDIHDTDTADRARHAADVLDTLARRPALELRFGVDMPYRTVAAALSSRLDVLAGA